MSELAALSGSLEWDDKRLRELNTSILALESESIGRAAELGIDSTEVEAAHATMEDFVHRLLKALRAPTPPPDLESLVGLVQSTPRPLADWISDLEGLDKSLESHRPVPKEALPIFESILSLLDDEFASELHRLYDHS
jgi:hypothetical protein